MRILAWNIRQGGGSRLTRIIEALAHRQADILVISEYLGGASAILLREALSVLGYRCITGITPPPGRSGVLIASRCAFHERGSIDSGLPEPYRMVSVEFPSFRLAGI